MVGWKDGKQIQSTYFLNWDETDEIWNKSTCVSAARLQLIDLHARSLFVAATALFTRRWFEPLSNAQDLALIL